MVYNFFYVNVENQKRGKAIKRISHEFLSVFFFLLPQGDAGAPVYCKAISNGEDILIGVAGTVSTCGGDGGSVPVIPVAN